MSRFFIRTIFLAFFVLMLLKPVLVLATIVSVSPSSVNINSGDQVTLDININNVLNLFGVAFDLIFNPSILTFISASKGAFLEQGGIATHLLTAVSPPGDLIVGYSRQAVNGVPTGIDGSGTIMRITFKAITNGSSSLSFQNNALCSASSSPICPAIPATWENGSITVGTVSDITPPPAPTGVYLTL